MNKAKKEFRCTGDMWSTLSAKHAFTDEGLAEDMVFAAEKGSPVGPKDVKAASKNHLLLVAPRIKDHLNLCTVLSRSKNKKNLVIQTCFPELVVKETVRAKLLDVYEYQGGFEGRLLLDLVPGRNNLLLPDKYRLWFFDTRYVVNKNKYKIGETYSFHIGALTLFLINRPKDQLTIPMNEELTNKLKEALIKSGFETEKSLAGKEDEPKIITTDMFSLNPADDDNPEVVFGKHQFNEPLSEFKHPIMDEKEYAYNYYINANDVDDDSKPLFRIPAYLSDGIIHRSLEEVEPSLRDNKIIANAPINTTLILQVRLAD